MAVSVTLLRLFGRVLQTETLNLLEISQFDNIQQQVDDDVGPAHGEDFLLVFIDFVGPIESVSGLHAGHRIGLMAKLQ